MASNARLATGHAALAGDTIIALRGVTKSYGEGATAFLALKGIDLDITQGDFVAVMGASGSGKSTTMNILGCLDVPSAGTFQFKGVHVETLDRDQRALLRRKYLGFVFQGFNLLARTSALENVELPLLYRGDAKKARHDTAMAALDKVGLADWWDHTPAELSGGQQHDRFGIEIGIDHRSAAAVGDIVEQVERIRGCADLGVGVIAGQPYRRHRHAGGARDRRSDQADADDGDAGEGQHGGPCGGSSSLWQAGVPRHAC